jgi:hypothetical protein
VPARALQVICPPSHGTWFQAPELQAALSQLLPAPLEQDLGVWLPDSKLLASGPMA